LEDIEKDSNKIDEMITKLSIDPKARAEDIKFDKWIVINDYLNIK